MATTNAQLSTVDIITRAIIDRLEAGVRPWVRPWRPGLGGRPLRVTGQPYHGVNCFWLWLAAENAGYASRTWMTYKQAQRLGGQVRKGERSQIAIFYKSSIISVDSPMSDEAIAKKRSVLRSYAVFNADQIDGLADQFLPVRLDAAPPVDILPDLAQRFVASLPATVHVRGDHAFYDPIADSITLPPVEVFATRAYWVSTLAHEAGHWSGHPDRLNRAFGEKFGDEAYAFEELVAEMSSALLGADLGLPTAHIDDHASYIASWLRILRRDHRAIMAAAAGAEAAAGFLMRACGLDHEDAADTIRAAT